MSEEGSGAGSARVKLSSEQLQLSSAEELQVAWATQDTFIDHLETLIKQLEGI